MPNIQASSKRNVTWMRTAVPAIDPIFKDHDIANALFWAATR